MAKNATEGMATPARILPFTLLLLCGQVLPILLALALAWSPQTFGPQAQAWILASLAASFLPRLYSVWRYRQPLMSALLHPLGIALLVSLQWYAFLRRLSGHQVKWKERAYRMG